MAWWNTGPITVEDLRVTVNDANRQDHDEVGLRRAFNADLGAMASQCWAPHVWFHDPRFTEFLPKGNTTVYVIATSGTPLDRRRLWDRHDALRVSAVAQGALSLLEAVAQYVEAISGRHGERLDVLLARTGLGGEDPISGIEAGRRLGVSQQHIYQIDHQLNRRRHRAYPPAGIWMPQVDTAERDGWPEDVSSKATAATRSFFLSGIPES
jgi:hypothetical protein